MDLQCGEYWETRLMWLKRYIRHLVGLAMRMCIEQGLHRKPAPVSSPFRAQGHTVLSSIKGGSRPSSPTLRNPLEDFLVNIHP
jgi:hypothetical protein